MSLRLETWEFAKWKLSTGVTEFGCKCRFDHPKSPTWKTTGVLMWSPLEWTTCEKSRNWLKSAIELATMVGLSSSSALGTRVSCLSFSTSATSVSYFLLQTNILFKEIIQTVQWSFNFRQRRFHRLIHVKRRVSSSGPLKNIRLGLRATVKSWTWCLPPSVPLSTSTKWTNIFYLLNSQ